MAELLAAIDSAKRKTVPGPDTVPYEAFKNLSNDVLAQLLDTIIEAWLSGVVPDSWKAAHVVSIPKLGKPAMVLENIRPISLTPTLCKLAEKMLATRLSQWLEQQ